MNRSSAIFVYILRHFFPSRDRRGQRRPPCLFTFSISMSSAIFVYIISRLSAKFFTYYVICLHQWPSRARSAATFVYIWRHSRSISHWPRAIFIYTTWLWFHFVPESVCLCTTVGMLSMFYTICVCNPEGGPNFIPSRVSNNIILLHTYPEHPECKKTHSYVFYGIFWTYIPLWDLWWTWWRRDRLFRFLCH